jgi:hypothetical protein
LLWLSHSVLAYYVALILGATYLLLASGGLAAWTVLRPHTAWRAAAAFAVLVGPYLLPLWILGLDYDIYRILSPPYQPASQFRPVISYLWESDWEFGHTATGLTVQLDHAMLVLMAAGLFLLAFRRPAPADQTRWSLLKPVMPFLIIVALGLLLQLPVATVFYDRVPGAAFIQFPWRLLALITPALIVAALCLADKVLPADGRHFVLGVVAAWMVVGCGAFAPLRDARIPLSLRLDGLTFSGFREYEPREAPPLADLGASLAARWLEAGCTYRRLDVDEVASVRFQTSCGRSAVLPLPVYASPVHVVRSASLERRQACEPLADFPAVCGAVIGAAEDTVSVDLPNMASLGRWIWRRLWGAAP